jgi:hypothetical protein
MLLEGDPAIGSLTSSKDATALMNGSFEAEKIWFVGNLRPKGCLLTADEWAVEMNDRQSFALLIKSEPLENRGRHERARGSMGGSQVGYSEEKAPQLHAITVKSADEFVRLLRAAGTDPTV